MSFTVNFASMAKYVTQQVNVPTAQVPIYPNYRFGYDAQEKVDEVAGIGNHYTALYWEYDPRDVKRWNLDPVTKPWRSPYSVFGNSPIWKVDPDGDDDYFNNKGQYIRSTKSGTKIRIEDNKTVYSLSDINFKKSNDVNQLISKLRIVGNIATYYGKQMAIESVMPGVNNGSLAYTQGENVFLSVSSKTGTVDEAMNDYNHLKNALSHEKGHVNQNIDFSERGIRPGDKYYYSDHFSVYMDQFNDKSFSQLDWRDKAGHVKNAVNFLINSYYKDDADHKPLLGQDISNLNEVLSKSKMSVELKDSKDLKEGFIIHTEKGSINASYEDFKDSRTGH